MSERDRFVRFAKHVSYRGIEKPHLFDVKNDELYELEKDGLDFIARVDGTVKESRIENRELLDYSKSEGLLEFTDEPKPRPHKKGSSPLPSLRYLELLITSRCNLKCAHCYLGDAGKTDMSAEVLARTVEEFDEMQGLRLLISGGEPLLYPNLEVLAGLINKRGFRSVLLTNGLELDVKTLDQLPVHEVQVSIDGLEAGHDSIRGKGTFKKAVNAARTVNEAGVDLSVATMIHSGNIEEIDELSELIQELGAREWSLEAPTNLGRWSGDRAAPLDKIGRAMSLGFGGSYHGADPGQVCGFHLAAVTPEGAVIPCGFYPDRPLGSVEKEGLEASWIRKRHPKISEIEVCARCEAAQECAGGCRFRAGETGPDPVMCAAYGKPLE